MKNMTIAFFLNLVFSIFEFIGGTYTNSVALTSDAIHDLGDAISIGTACLMEKRSRKPADNKFTFGYSRYSVLSAMKTSAILITGSIAIIVNAINKIMHPEPINYNGMLLFAVIGLVFNILAVFFTKHGDSLNQKSINLHMLEDVMSWAIVLIGAIIMKFTDFAMLDIILSIGTSVFILINSFKNIKSATNILADKVPSGINPRRIKSKILMLDNVRDVHHFRIWSLDEHNIYSTIHVICNSGFNDKEKIREILHEAGITNSTIEIENTNSQCNEKEHIFRESTHHH